MAILFWFAFMTWICFVLYMGWRTGRFEITTVVPKTRHDKSRIIWVVICAVNFLAFTLDMVIKGTCAFPSGGQLVDGHYLVSSHGREISFTPAAFWFSYAHGVVFVIVHLVCMFALWRLRRTKDLRNETVA
jgi:hypothetical protein